MTNLLIIITATLILINIVISLFKKSKIDLSSIINSTVNKLDAKIQDQFQRNRSEASNELKQNREELSNTLNLLSVPFLI